jgi:hypothetical protein
MAGPHFTWKPQANWADTVSVVTTGATGVNFAWMGKDVSDELRKYAAKGIRAAGIHATRRLKEVLSVPAPRRRVKFRAYRQGTRHAAYIEVIKYVATVHATYGAPPRKLSGTLRRSITYEFVSSTIVEGQAVRVGTNVFYGRDLELVTPGKHQWLVKTIKAIANELAYIIGDGLAGGGVKISGLMGK